VSKPRRRPPPKSGIATYWQPSENDYETWHDKRSADGHFFHSIFVYGLVDTMQTEDERRLGTRPSYIDASRRFRESCRVRGFDPDTFRITLQRLP
jgi:hypothetical protein